MKTPLPFFLLLGTAIQAQQWAPLGATWTYTYAVDNLIDPDPPVLSAYALTVTGDTVLAGHVCSRVEGSLLACHTNLGFTYESGDTVHLWNEVAGNFSPLYRWNALPGESWVVPIHGMFGPDTLTYVVVTTGTTTINGQLRRTLDVQLSDPLSYAFSGGQLIEGIGDLGFLFPWYTALCDGFTMGPLRCYEDSVVGLYMRPGVIQCDMGTGVETVDESVTILIVPSLAHRGESVPVTTSSPDLSHVEVIDLTGRLVLREELRNGTAELRLNAASSYVVRAIGPTSMVARRLTIE